MIIAKRPQDFIQIGRDADFVVEKVLQPEIVVLLGHIEQWQQIAEADANSWFRTFAGFSAMGFVVNAKVCGHEFLPDDEHGRVKAGPNSPPSFHQKCHRSESTDNLDDSRGRPSVSPNDLAYNDMHDGIAGRENAAK